MYLIILIPSLSRCLCLLLVFASATVFCQTADAPLIHLSLPSNGELIANFVDTGSKGVDYSGNRGDPVLAAASGKVVYAGNTLKGYGNLVLIKHDPIYLTAYAHNNSLLVKEGDSVQAGDKIAQMGNSDSQTVKLHFELRLNGKPVDPIPFFSLKSADVTPVSNVAPSKPNIPSKIQHRPDEAIKRCTRMGLTPNTTDFNICIGS